jgi:FtsZ-interacting cell division protein ZipA
MSLSVDEDLDFLPIELELPERLTLSLDDVSSLVKRRTTTTSTTSTNNFNHHSRGTSGSWAHHQHNPLYSSYNPNAHLSDTNKSSNMDDKEEKKRPSTPQKQQQQQQQQQKSSSTNSKTPDILGTIISPPMALLRSPAATGLTKTYANNDFRQLRQVPSARTNTSRLPSMHGEWVCVFRPYPLRIIPHTNKLLFSL